MRRFVFAALCFSTSLMGQTADTEYSRKKVASVFVSYSGDSSHIIIGQQQNRKIVGLGAGLSWRLVHKRAYDFMYEAELRPLTFVKDPYVSGVSTVVINGRPTGTVEIPDSGPFAGPSLRDCASGTTVTTVPLTNGASYTQTVVQTCSSRWTYAGGLSPLGVRFQFAKAHRWQPYLVANGGFLVSGVDVPVNDSSNFNFTFEGGAGVEWFRDRRQSWAVDYRLHHLSNAYMGFYNPGIDSQTVRVSYRFGR